MPLAAATSCDHFRSSPTERPLAHARGSEQSRDGNGAVATEYEPAFVEARRDAVV
jgi:hypothetical protein